MGLSVPGRRCSHPAREGALCRAPKDPTRGTAEVNEVASARYAIPQGLLPTGTNISLTLSPMMDYQVGVRLILPAAKPGQQPGVPGPHTDINGAENCHIGSSRLVLSCTRS